MHSAAEGFRKGALNTWCSEAAVKNNKPGKRSNDDHLLTKVLKLVHHTLLLVCFNSRLILVATVKNRIDCSLIFDIFNN